MTNATVTVTKTVRGEVISEERRRLEVWHCGGCGLLYAVDAEWAQNRRDDGKGFYCPNGCSRVFRETEAERERKRAERAEAATNGALERLAAEQRAHSATKGILTKTKNRIHAGVCPECKRHFQNLENHMHSKHGTPEEAAKVAAEHRS